MNAECMDKKYIGALGSIYFVGLMIGALFFVRMADIKGRRGVMIIGMIATLISVLGIVLSKNMELMYIF